MRILCRIDVFWIGKHLGTIIFFTFLFYSEKNPFRMLEKRSMSYSDGLIPVPQDDIFLNENVKRIQISDTGDYAMFF